MSCISNEGNVVSCNSSVMHEALRVMVDLKKLFIEVKDLWSSERVMNGQFDWIWEFNLLPHRWRGELVVDTYPKGKCACILLWYLPSRMWFHCCREDLQQFQAAHHSPTPRFRRRCQRRHTRSRYQQLWPLHEAVRQLLHTEAQRHPQACKVPPARSKSRWEASTGPWLNCQRRVTLVTSTRRFEIDWLLGFT